MNKKSKRALSAIVALTLAASVATAVSATDYAEDPDYRETSIHSSTTTGEVNNAIDNAGTTDGSTETDDASENADAIEDAVDSAVEDEKVATVKVTSTKKLTISAATVRKLVDTETTLEIISPKATLTVNHATIEKVKKLDLSFSISNKKTRTKVTFKSKGSFCGPVKVMITDCKLSEKKLKKAHVYMNGEDLGPIQFEEDGTPYFMATKGGVYIIK